MEIAAHPDKKHSSSRTYKEGVCKAYPVDAQDALTLPVWTGKVQIAIAYFPELFPSPVCEEDP
jgi:hypothetical protein